MLSRELALPQIEDGTSKMEQKYRQAKMEQKYGRRSR